MQYTTDEFDPVEEIEAVISTLQYMSESAQDRMDCIRTLNRIQQFLIEKENENVAI